jgi:hypothetical protein
MIKLFAKYNTVDRTLQDVRLLTLCSLAYTVLLRYNELCNIKAKHIKMYDPYVDIVVEKNKSTVLYLANNLIVMSEVTGSFFFIGLFSFLLVASTMYAIISESQGLFTPASPLYTREISCIRPCPEIYVGLYLQNLMESAQHFNVIESAYYSIKWACWSE